MFDDEKMPKFYYAFLKALRISAKDKREEIIDELKKEGLYEEGKGKIIFAYLVARIAAEGFHLLMAERYKAASVSWYDVSLPRALWLKDLALFSLRKLVELGGCSEERAAELKNEWGVQLVGSGF